MDGSGQAGEAAEEAQEALARVRRYAEDHARLRIAALLLRHAIERYSNDSDTTSPWRPVGYAKPSVMLLGCIHG